MYVHRVRVDGIRGFHGPRAADITFSRRDEGKVFARYPGLTVIAGRNGSGKTTFLRALAAVLAGPEVANTLTEGVPDWISHGSAHGSVQVEVRRDQWELNLGSGRPADTFTARMRWNAEEGARPRPQADWTRPRSAAELGQIGGRMAERSLWAVKPSGWFAAGYGPFRRLAGTSGEVARLMAGDWTAARFATLFREEASLAETVQWLQQVNYRARFGRANYAELEHQVIALLNDGLFPDGHVVDRVDPDGLWIQRRDSTPIRVDEMSDGYRTVAALVTDIVRQIYECFDGKMEWAKSEGEPQKHVPALENSGVVLIDEIDVHLHVSWQKKIGPWLKLHFPYVQFIVSTHSPYVCQTADTLGIIRLPGPDDTFAPELASPELFQRVVGGSADDATLSELFGLDSPYSDQVSRHRDRLHLLEERVATEMATDDEEEEYSRLVSELLPSPFSLAQRAAQRSLSDTTD